MSEPLTVQPRPVKRMKCDIDWALDALGEEGKDKPCRA